MHTVSSKHFESGIFRFFSGVVHLGLLSLVSLVGCSKTASTNPASTSNNVETKSVSRTASKAGIQTRLFWQDRSKLTLCYTDLLFEKAQFKIAPKAVTGFPELSTEENDLVQMTVVDGRLFVGVRDHANGTHASGWVELTTGIEEESHGDHSHWHYVGAPKILHSQIDDQQGNPAHVYRYDDRVFLANDKKNGFTQVVLSKSDDEKSEARFFSGGGGHITLAAVANRIAYSSWIDRKGENAGRVDVVSLRGENPAKGYSFRLPTGGIHGAIACGNRAFFAPAEGVCWVDADFDLRMDSDSVQIHQLSLNPKGGEGYRTGAFFEFQDHVLCIANGKSGQPALCVIDGTTPAPSVIRVDCDLPDGLRLSTVKAIRSSSNQSLAFAFAEGSGVQEFLYVFNLDPNGDNNFGDAKFELRLEVGKSQLEGHFGHHGIAFVPDRKTAVITNPGDGTLTLIDLVEKKLLTTLQVGGQPTHVVSFGSRP